MYNIFYSINIDFNKFFTFLLIIIVICYTTALDILLTFLKNNLQNHYISWYKFSHISYFSNSNFLYTLCVEYLSR